VSRLACAGGRPTSLPVQARRLFPNCSVEEVAVATVIDSSLDGRRNEDAAMVKKSTRHALANPYLRAATPDDLGPADRIAYDIVADRRDLLPSVERIMNAGLDEESRVGALTLFRSSLGVVGDPNRDPRVAIAAYASAATGDEQ